MIARAALPVGKQTSEYWLTGCAIYLSTRPPSLRSRTKGQTISSRPCQRPATIMSSYLHPKKTQAPMMQPVMLLKDVMPAPIGNEWLILFPLQLFK